MRNGLSYSEAGKLGYLKSKEKCKERFRKMREDYDKNPKKCKLCDKNLSFENKQNSFCNHSCAAKFSKNGSFRRLKKEMKKHDLDINNPKDKQYYLEKIKVCLNCGKPISIRNKYCNSQCCGDYQWKKTKESIVEKKAINGILDSRIAKKYLKEIRGAKCEICGITEWLAKEVPLVLDHINGNSTDWSLENLRLICGNCDMQTDTYKGKNRGNGRYSRTLRYKSGKSY